ncbi:hypothetical protein LEL_10432 [Akanthomyces lecanii RCEF 1005]|uniref:Uncharacterized protein n=1 Tax=Akanthomyces lecanii RCEF 1005 TaxID=1081108 RepID=A0A167YHK4_CORDF|nr:hypothetical protein LEL_10432 [Akanthomyces lecanii RCEF 1005]
MDSPTQMAYQSLLREVHLLVDKFEQLRPFIRGALQFPRDQVFSLWRAVSALALPVNEAQSQLLAEAVTLDNATHDSMQNLYSEGFVPEIGRVHSADMAESVLAENLAVIFVLNGELPKETADRDQSTGLPDDIYATLSHLGAKYPLQGNWTFLNWLQMVGARRDEVKREV